jgi:ribosomal-protein-alanine N-acetyltransferase
MTRLAADEAEVLTIAVVPTAQRRGLGSQLLVKAAGHVHACGARTMFLEVSESNEPARALYRRFGFSTVGRRPSYYGPSMDALLLRANLPLAAF